MRNNGLVAAALVAAAAGGAGAGAVSRADSCHADNCLRALKAAPGGLQSARAFCASYTTAADGSRSSTIPSFVASHCKDSDIGKQNERLSSACACVASKPTETAATTPTTSTSSSSISTHQHPCAEASASWAKAGGGATATIAASLAHECLESVPLNKDAALELVDAIEPYLEWQTDTAYKKDPPKDYPYPPFDLLAGFATVRENLDADKYTGEYDFQIDLQRKVFAGGADTQYAFSSDILSRAFRFQRQVALVSISEDGNSLPVVKLYEDVKASPKTARAVKYINGVAAAKYVLDIGNSNPRFQDVDTTYNNMFYSKASASFDRKGDFYSGGRSGLFYPGDNITITFEDDTTSSYENKALVGDLSGVTDGESFYKKFCTPMDEAALESKETDLSDYTIPGYPKPTIATKDGVVSGYYLAGDDLDDVAVMTFRTFNPENNTDFQDVIGDFLREASQSGKKKLIIDLQNNTGGSIMLAYELFGQLLPGTLHNGLFRWRGGDDFQDVAKAASKAAETFDPNHSNITDMIGFLGTWFNYRSDLNLTYQNFSTFSDKYGPHIFKDTQYTANMRWNLSSSVLTTNPYTGLGIEFSGYGSRTNLTQYFKPEDIVMLYDGVCSSTCSIISELLRTKGGVKSVAFGGRPKTGPIQGVGGSKGAQGADFATIYLYAQLALNVTDDPAIKANLAKYTDLPTKRSTGSALNVCDAILPDNIDDGLPAQYVREDADCRLYWTALMITDVTEVWKSAAKAAFKGGKCAYGGISGS